VRSTECCLAVPQRDEWARSAFVYRAPFKSSRPVRLNRPGVPVPARGRAEPSPASVASSASCCYPGCALVIALATGWPLPGGPSWRWSGGVHVRGHPHAYPAVMAEREIDVAFFGPPAGPAPAWRMSSRVRAVRPPRADGRRGGYSR